jgi:hypothetical protein
MTTQHRGKLSRDSESIYTEAWEGDAVELPGGQRLQIIYSVT